MSPSRIAESGFEFFPVALHDRKFGAMICYFNETDIINYRWWLGFIIKGTISRVPPFFL